MWERRKSGEECEAVKKEGKGKGNQYKVLQNFREVCKEELSREVTEYVAKGVIN